MGAQESKIKGSQTLVVHKPHQKDKIYAHDAKMRLGSFKRGKDYHHYYILSTSGLNVRLGNALSIILFAICGPACLARISLSPVKWDPLTIVFVFSHKESNTQSRLIKVILLEWNV